MTVTPTGTEQPIDVPAEVHDERYPYPRVVFTLEPHRLLALLDVDSTEWEYDEATTEWALGQPVVFLSFQRVPGTPCRRGHLQSVPGEAS